MINKETYSKHECFGYLATFLGFAGVVPQLYKTYKTRDAKSFSLAALLIGLFRSFLWLLHGYYIGATSSMISSYVGLFYHLVLIYAKLVF